MAEITSNQTAAASKKAAAPRSKKLSTRIDMTPMVDLGFLLITFFMLTTSLQKGRVMTLVMPEDDGKTTEPVKASKVLNLILGRNDQIFWYRGLEKDQIDSCDFSEKGLRRVILASKDAVESEFGLTKNEKGEPVSHLVALVKPSEKSTHKNLIDALGEMAICEVSTHVLVAPSLEELAILE